MLGKYVLRIRDVSATEIEQLNTLVSSLSDSILLEFRVVFSKAEHYELLMNPIRSGDISEVIRRVAQVVRPDRIVCSTS